MAIDRFRRHRLEALEPRIVLDASDLRITEFMASNSGVVLDADGEDSDWVEIFNAGAETVDLGGLYLTDDPDDLTQWQFPEDNLLAPGSFRLVFASGKDDVLGVNELHTNFGLSADGEDLLLVDTDGVTILDQFAAFPPQQEDISYGREMVPAGGSVTLLEEGVAAAALVPSNGSLGLIWTVADFDDSAWPLQGPTGFGYENSPGAGVNFIDEIATSVPSGTTTLYVRVPFTLESRENLGALTLNMRYDDGFVAYINGFRVVDANAPETLTWTSDAAGGQSDFLAEQFTPFDISSAIPHLRDGENVLAIHALNGSGSSDMLISPQLVAGGSQLALPEDIGHFTTPTPGYGNIGESVNGYAQTPQYSVPHGFYETAQSVELTSPTEDATIVYTTDGSTPAVDANLNVVNGTQYNGALNIDSTTVVRAIAFKQDFEPSLITASSYIFLDDVVQQSPNGEAPGPDWPSFNVNGQDIDYGMDPQIISQYGSEALKESLASLTSFSITTDVDNLFDPNIGIYVNAGNRGRDWERPASVELIDPSGVEEGFTVNAGLRIRGGFSRSNGNPKHAFRLYFRGEYGDTKLNYPLFGDEGTDEFDVLDLRTSQNYSWAFQGDSQNTFLREVFARDLQRDLEQPYTRSRYHHLYVDGQYWGLFMTQERIQKFYGESYFGGDEDDYDVVKSDNINGRRTEIADGNDEAWRQLFDLSRGLDTDPVSNADNYWTMQGLNPDGSRNPDLPVLLDVDNVIDYVMMIFYTGGFDTGISQFLGNDVANNWQGAYNRVAGDQGFQFFMHDNEHSLGTNNSDTIDRTGPFNSGNEANFAYFNPHFLHQNLLSSSAYVSEFSKRAQMHMTGDGAMTPAANIARMNARRAEVEPAIIAESARWGDADRGVPLDKDDWENEVNSIINQYFPVRTSIVISQLTNDGLWLLDPPSFSHAGGEVPAGFLLEMSSATQGRILYTTDGSDPQLPNGSVNADSVTIYRDPIAINASQTILARVYVTSTLAWSSLTSATFIVDAAPVPGDYDGSGEVDGGDLSVWEDEFGQQGDWAADGNGDERVDGFDFLLMQRNHGATAAPATVTGEAASTAEQLAALHSADVTAPLQSAVALVESSSQPEIAFVATWANIGKGLAPQHDVASRAARRPQFTASRRAELDDAFALADAVERNAKQDVGALHAALNRSARGFAPTDEDMPGILETDSDAAVAASVDEALADLLHKMF